MDHLELPKSQHQKPVRVKFLCDGAAAFDKKDFVTFPARKDWPELTTTHHGFPYSVVVMAETVDNETIRCREKILQAWVFFGLLYEILSPFELYDEVEYIDTSEDGSQWLCTPRLNDRILQWQQNMQALDNDRKGPLIEHFRNCLAVAVEALLILKNENHWPFDRLTAFSLFVICNTVQGMILSHLSEDLHTLKPNIMNGHDDNTRELMRQNGWCPFDTATMESGDWLPPSAVWYLMHLHKPHADQGHANCTADMCERVQVTDLQGPRHVNESCNCSFLEPDPLLVAKCLKNKDYPTLEIVGEELDEIDLVVHPFSSFDKETEYIAISHVWADGLGNSRRSSLPRCQIRRLRNLLEGIRSQTIYVDSKPYVLPKRVLLWCDTLCVPVDPEHKAIALGIMRDVYLNAAYVMVLDSEIQQCVYDDIGLVEAGWRLSLSRYMRRLWTYQEAGLAKKLVVQFKDKPVDVLQIMQTAAKMYHDSPVRERLYLFVAAKLVSIRAWYRAEPQTAWIKEAGMGLSDRRVSFAADEPICLATVLGLDGELVARTAPEQRVSLLWRLISQHERGVGESVVFNTLDRLTSPGYRWAPRSFLQSPTRQMDFITIPGDSRVGVLTAQGLRVRRSGWRLRPGVLPGCIDDTFWPDFDAALDLSIVRHLDGTCYNLVRPLDQDHRFLQTKLLDLLKNTEKDWFVILQNPATRFDHVRFASQQKGLLVSKESSEYGLTYYRTHMLLAIDRVSPQIETRRTIDFIYGQTIRRSWHVNMLSFLMVLKKTLSRGISYLPRHVRTTIQLWTTSLFAFGTDRLEYRIKYNLCHSKTRAPSIPAVAKLMSGSDDETLMERLGSELVQAFMGRYADIVEEFDDTTEWCID